MWLWADTCGSDCKPLASDEWLALRSAFTAPAKPTGGTIAARTHTFLKKSECHSSTLPPSMSKPIPQGTVVTVLGDVDAAYALVKDAR